MRYIVKTMGLVVCFKVLFLPFLPPPLFLIAAGFNTQQKIKHERDFTWQSDNKKAHGK